MRTSLEIRMCAMLIADNNRDRQEIAEPVAV
jgi:hypothetical protein